MRHPLLAVLTLCAALGIVPAHADITVKSGRDSGERISGSGHRSEEVRNLTGFNALRLLGPIDVTLRAGDAERVTVQADDNLLPMIETRVEGTTLVVGIRRNAHFTTRNPIRATIAFRELNAVSSNGSGDIRADRIEGRQFALSLSGSGDVVIEELITETLAVSISGSSDVRFGRGSAPVQGYSIAGSGDIAADQLTGRQVAVKIAGSGDARVHATESLEVSIAGSGDVRYRGAGQVRKSIAGSGDVQPIR